MKQIEKNIVNSFNTAKADIAKLQTLVLQLSNENKSLQVRIASLEKKKTKPVAKKVTKKVAKKKVVKKAVSKRRTTRYVSANDSKKFHVDACPFAKNIMPKKRVHYKSKIKALNEGLKPCKCVK